MAVACAAALTVNSFLRPQERFLSGSDSKGDAKKGITTLSLLTLLAGEMSWMIDGGLS